MVSPTVIALLAAVALLAGLVTGVAGFGFALLSTAVVATLLDPASAVVLLIVPILGVNLSLAAELDVADVQTCLGRFGPFLGAALLGTLAGMAVLDALPRAPLLVGLGLLTLGFSAIRAGVVPAADAAAERCFVETPAAMVGVGGVSGAVFGATNVGVQLVAYVRSCELPHPTFVGVVAVLFLGINGARVAGAAALGLYPSLAFVSLSAGLAVPAAAGSLLGSRIRPRVSEAATTRLVLALLVVVGVRLLLAGLGVA